MTWLGIDIGGANLKAADAHCFAASRSFPLWKRPDDLAAALIDLIAESPACDSLAITMTGELADCFVTKAEGVNTILSAVELAAAGRQVLVYLCDGRWVEVGTARAEALLAGASNWHALAAFAGRYLGLGELGLLVDIGSTTCDLIPLGPTGPVAMGMTDPERLAAGELVYTGIERSPVCAVVFELPWRGAPCSVAQEFFAQTQDAYVLLDELEEDIQNCDTADGRPLTKKNAHARLARSICADTTMFSMADAYRAATVLHATQLELLVNAARRVLVAMTEAPTTIVLSGHGEFLGRKLLERLQLETSIVSLTSELGPAVSRSACAHALAVMASERADP